MAAKSILAILLLTCTAAFAQSPPITITITAPSTTITAGCGLSISIEVRNNLKKPILLGEIPEPTDRPSQGEYLFRIHAADAAGRPAPVSAFEMWARHFIPQGSKILVPLDPGALVKTRAIVTQMFDISAPGTYKVWVTRKRGPYKGASSNVLTITVSPPS